METTTRATLTRAKTIKPSLIKDRPIRVMTGAMTIQDRDMLTLRRSARTVTTPIILMLVHHTASTVRSGLRVEYLSVPGRGMAGAMVDTGAVRGIGVGADTGAVTAGVTDEAMRAADTGAAMPVTMAAAATDAVTPVEEDSRAAPFVVEAVTMAAARFAAVADPMAEVVSTAAEVAPTLVAGPTVADTGNGL